MNPMHFAVAQHYQGRDMVISKLVEWARQGVTIDEDIIKSTLARYGVSNDGFAEDISAIKKEVETLYRRS